jgi:membrane protein DedA with SNARE-associated domain
MNFRKIIAISVLLTTLTWNIEAQEQKETQKTTIEKLEGWYEQNMNYATITVLMTIESSFIPLPSEIVIPPAAYIASKPGSRLNIYLVVLFGTLGAIMGALLNYGLAGWLGRPLLYKLADSKAGKLFFLNSKKIENAEAYFNKNGNISTFIGRLLPGIRHLISIPAGLSRMRLSSFILFTATGALIWNITLALMGYWAQGQMGAIMKYSHEFSIGILSLVGVGILYIAVRYFSKKSKR